MNKTDEAREREWILIWGSIWMLVLTAIMVKVWPA